MATQLNNQYTFDSRLVAEAVQVPDGAFIVIDDLAFAENGLGRKIAQTMAVEIEGRHVSLAYVDDDATTYDLVLAEDNPEVIGTFQQLQSRHADAYGRLVQAFGGVGKFSPHEMVIALHWLQGRKMSIEFETYFEAASFARQQSARSAWVVGNRYDAMALAPVDWKTLGI